MIVDPAHARPAHRRAHRWSTLEADAAGRRASTGRCWRPARDQAAAVRLYERCGYRRRGASAATPTTACRCSSRSVLMNLDDDDFELFGLPRALRARRRRARRALARAAGRVHPDRFAAEGAAAQRMAMQWAVRVNEAYQRLKDPLKRAAYLCELRGAPIDAEDNTAMPARLPDAADGMARGAGRGRAATPQARGAGRRGRAPSAGAAGAAARSCSTSSATPAGRGAAGRALMFVQRFRADVEQRLEALETTESRWRCCRSPNPARRPTRTSGASRSASTWAPRIRWWPRCATAWPNACPTRRAA